MTFYLSGRLTDQQNWLFGERRFLPSDSSSFQATNPDDWNIVATGDGAAVAMNPFESMSGQGKVTWQVTPTFKASYNLLANTTTGRNYNHAFRLNPDGVPTSETASYNHLLKFEQTLGTRSFYNLNLALYVNELDNRLFEDPNDERYTSVFGRGIQPQFVFETGGLIPDVLNRDSRTYAARFDFTTQLTKSNLVKLGAEVRYHDLFFEFFRIEVDPIRFGTYERFIPPVTSLNNDTYSVNPLEIAAFIQDKIEIQDLIVNVGLRLDYFDPQSVIPTDLRDPSNRIFVGPADEAFEDVDPKIQLSPRLGLAFPITERGVIHASYGQFFQIPEFARLYENPEFEVVGVFSEFVGNADLEAQRTDMYEIGVQQQLNDFSAVDVTMFYRDVRNLLGTDLFETYRADFYGRYANDDYGAVRGVTVALDVVVREMGVSAGADYTYQAAKGIASDPKQEFFDAAGRNEGAVSLAPLNWDARHSGNLFVSYNAPSWGASVVSRATSGFPFTPRNAQTGSSFVELRNRARYRGSFFVDLRAYYQFDLAGFTPQVFIRLDNAFDTVRRDFLPRLDPREEAAHLANGLGVVNTRYDFALNPAAQPVPRTLRFGLKVGF
ncbi:MAG: TonB-dependent receptor [Bacteroidota bacterium]